jgi:hypothetical protein
MTIETSAHTIDGPEGATRVGEPGRSCDGACSSAPPGGRRRLAPPPREPHQPIHDDQDGIYAQLGDEADRFIAVHIVQLVLSSACRR